MMTARKRLVPWLTLLLGAIGVAICVAGMLAVCLIGLRLGRVIKSISAQIDKSFVIVDEKLDRAGQRVRAAKITANDIQQSLKKWTKAEARERLTSRLDVEAKALQLSSVLQQADGWLEFAELSVQVVQQGLELTRSTGVPIEAGPAEVLLEEIAALREQLTEASELVERIRVRTAETGRGPLRDAELSRVIELALRVVATVGSLDVRLADLRNRLADTAEKVQGIKAATIRWLLIATVGTEMLLIWMAAGQVALCLFSKQTLHSPAS